MKKSLSPMQSPQKDEYTLSFRTFPPKVEDDVVIKRFNPAQQGPPGQFRGTPWNRTDPSPTTLRVLSTVRPQGGGLPGGSWKAPHGYAVDMSTPERLLEAAAVVAQMPRVYRTLNYHTTWEFGANDKKKFFSLQFTLRKSVQAKNALGSYLADSSPVVTSCLAYSINKYRPLWVVQRVLCTLEHDIVWSPVCARWAPALPPREQGLLAAFRALPRAHQEGALRKLQQAGKHAGEKRKREEAVAAAEAAVKKAKEDAARCVSPTWD